MFLLVDDIFGPQDLQIEVIIGEPSWQHQNQNVQCRLEQPLAAALRGA